MFHKVTIFTKDPEALVRHIPADLVNGCQIEREPTPEEVQMMKATPNDYMIHEYERNQADTIVYTFKDDFEKEMLYLTIGLNEEAGEVGGVVKKWLRGDYNLRNNPERMTALRKEIGDVLWYAIRMAHLTGVSLTDVLMMNQRKLAERYQKGTIMGNGDNR